MARVELAEADFTLGARVAQPQRAAMPTAEVFGAEIGQTVERAAGQALVLEQRAQLARQQEAEAEVQRRDAADRLTTAAELAQAREELRVGAEDIADQLRRGELPAGSAQEQWGSTLQRVREERGAKVPQGLRGEFERGLAQSLPGASAAVRRAERDRNIADNRANLGRLLESLQRDAAAGKPGAVDTAITYLEELGGHAGYTEAEVQSIGQKFVEGVAYTRAFSLVNGARGDLKALTAAEKALGGTDFAALDPQRRAQLQVTLEGFRAAEMQRREVEARRREAESAAALRRAQASFDGAMSLINAGKTLAPEYVERVSRETSGTPFSEAFKQALKAAPMTTSFAALPLPQQEATLLAARSQLNTGGTSPEVEKRMAEMQRVHDAAKRDYANDPLPAALERGVVRELAPLNLSSMDALQNTLTQRARQADTVRVVVGRAVSPLTAAEAQTLTRMLSTLPVEQKATSVAQFATLLPPNQAAALAKQIDSQDRALALAMAAGTVRTTDGKTVSELILRGQQAARDKSVKEERGAEFGVRAMLAKEVGDSIPGQAREDVIDAARFIYLGKQAAGERVSERGAVELALGGPIIEHNGRRIPVPAGIDQQTMAERLTQMPRAAIEAQTADATVYLPGRRPMGVPEFLAALPAAQLEPAGFGKYTVRAGGSLVTNHVGQPIIVEVPR